jgi:hypothetical protein
MRHHIGERNMQIRNGTGNDEAGIIFTGCGVTDAMQPQQQAQAQAAVEVFFYRSGLFLFRT